MRKPPRCSKGVVAVIAGQATQSSTPAEGFSLGLRKRSRGQGTASKIPAAARPSLHVISGPPPAQAGKRYAHALPRCPRRREVRPPPRRNTSGGQAAGETRQVDVVGGVKGESRRRSCRESPGRCRSWAAARLLVHNMLMVKLRSWFSRSRMFKGSGGGLVTAHARPGGNEPAGCRRKETPGQSRREPRPKAKQPPGRAGPQAGRAKSSSSTLTLVQGPMSPEWSSNVAWSSSSSLTHL